MKPKKDEISSISKAIYKHYKGDDPIIEIDQL